MRKALFFNGMGGRNELQKFPCRPGDRLVFDDAVFASLGTVGSTINASAFVAGAGLTVGQDADDRLVFDTAAGNLYYDVDGSGTGSAVLLVHLGNSTLDLFDCLVG